MPHGSHRPSDVETNLKLLHEHRVHIRWAGERMLSSQGNLLSIALQDAAERSSATFQQGYFDAALIKVLACLPCMHRLTMVRCSRPGSSAMAVMCMLLQLLVLPKKAVLTACKHEPLPNCACKTMLRSVLQIAARDVARFKQELWKVTSNMGNAASAQPARQQPPADGQPPGDVSAS